MVILASEPDAMLSENPLVGSVSAEVWRNITKNSKNADFKKTGPQLPPITHPPWTPGGQKIFGEVSGIHLCPTHPIWPKKLGRITSFGRIDAWPPLWLHCALYGVLHCSLLRTNHEKKKLKVYVWNNLKFFGVNIKKCASVSSIFSRYNLLPINLFT